MMEEILTSVEADLDAREQAHLQRITARLSGLSGLGTLFGGPTTPRAKESQPASAPAPEPRASERQYWPSDGEWFPAAIREAVGDGLDPNTSWTEAEVDPPKATGGCGIPVPTLEWEAWFHWNTPLHRAIWVESFDSADYLLKKGADPDSRNAFGRTPLHEAVDRGRKDSVLWLISEARADVEAVTLDAQVRWECGAKEAHGSGGMLPLHLALWNGDSAVMRLLLDGGASLTLSTDGWTLLDMALLAEDRRAMVLLMSRGADFSLTESGQGEAQSLPDQKGAARELLAVTSSDRLVPPAELLSVYHYTLSQIDTHDVISTLDSLESLIGGFFGKLYEVAGLEAKAPAAGLCPRCAIFQARLHYYFQDEENGSNLEFKLHETEDCLERSASKGCSICSLASDALHHTEDVPKYLRGTGRSLFDNSEDVEETEEVSTDLAVYVEVFVRSDAQLKDEMTVRCGQMVKKLELHSLQEDYIPDQWISDNFQLGSGSQRAFWMARKWLEECNNSSAHPICQKLAQEQHPATLLPSMLLYVGDEHNTPRLVGDVNDSMTYVALSYCQDASGGVPRTTKLNLEAHKSSLPLKDLPVMFQEAIDAAKCLGFKYIWIDTLCTVHGDERHQTAQAVKSHAIFSRANLTISSLTAETPSDNLFLPRTGRTPYPVPLQVWRHKACRPGWKNGVIYCFAAIREWLQNKRLNIEGPIHSQGWSLQEQVFSPRMIYFGDGMLHWECPCKYLTEADAAQSLGWSMGLYQKTRSRAERKCAVRGASIQDVAQRHEKTLDVWKTQLEEYTRMILPKHSHRLAAFWSLSKHMEKTLDNDFLGGIWHGDKFVESLCWNPVSPASGKPSIPSWTWASIPAEVSFKYLDKGGRPNQVTPLTSLVSHSVEIDPISYQVTGSIALKGTLYPTSILKNCAKSKHFRLQYSPDYVAIGEDVPDEAYVLDILGFEHGPPYEGFGFPMYPQGRPPAKVIMLLQKLGKDSAQYRRIGLGMLEMKEGGLLLRDGPPIRPMWIDDNNKFENVVTIV